MKDEKTLEDLISEGMVSQNDDGTLQIKLHLPFKFGKDREVESLKLRRPKAKDIRKLPAEGLSLGDMLDLVGRLTGEPKSLIDEIEMKDVTLLSEVVQTFL